MGTMLYIAISSKKSYFLLQKIPLTELGVILLKNIHIFIFYIEDTKFEWELCLCLVLTWSLRVIDEILLTIGAVSSIDKGSSAFRSALKLDVHLAYRHRNDFRNKILDVCAYEN